MPLLILLLLLVCEISLLVSLVDAIGVIPTVLWILFSGVLGLWLIRRTGLSVMRRMQEATARGELPTTDLLGDMLLLLAGVLFLLPGVLLDLFAFGVLALGGLRFWLAGKVQQRMHRAQPQVRMPVTLEGEYRRRDDPPQ